MNKKFFIISSITYLSSIFNVHAGIYGGCVCTSATQGTATHTRYQRECTECCANWGGAGLACRRWFADGE